MKLKDISIYLGGELKGDPEIDIVGVASILEAQAHQITFLAHKKYLKDLADCQAGAIVVPREITPSLPHIKVKNPYLAFAHLLELFYPKPKPVPGISPQAYISPKVQIAEGVTIFPFVYIGEETVIGRNTIIYPGSFIGSQVKIGCNTTIYANVSIYDQVSIGNEVIIHSGSVIGSDGFGFVKKEDGTHHKIPQIGRVVIEDQVEIGANVCIDRANLGETVIKAGTKLDNLSHIAHNVVIGENSIIVAQVGISGSCTIGKNVTLAGQVGIVDHINIGDNAIVVAQSGITQDVATNTIVSGSPAIPHPLWRKVQVSLPKLPDLIKTLRQLEKRVALLETSTQKEVKNNED
jgi:UDP-3-O-[3-hydroxymyristoyl] glucosamine N-acyltransferase